MRVLLSLLLLSIFMSSTVHAEVLCSGKSGGAIHIRTDCKRTEVKLDMVALGLIGPQGPKGDTGLQGLKGETGVQGPKGDIGITGAQGPIGLQGIQGVAGAQGAKGDTGDQGAKGETGATGSQGPLGATGLQGPTGLTGATGPQGVGLQSNAYTINSAGNGGYIEISSANGHFSLNYFCNYSGYYGYNWFAYNSSVTSGSVVINGTVSIGNAINNYAWNDLHVNGGGQDDISNHPAPTGGEQANFVAIENGVVTDIRLNVFQDSSRICHISVVSNGTTGYLHQ